jgi:asparagine synthetase B (glutamine-hydrolysing)
VPVGVFLSGGLDSSLITAFALKVRSTSRLQRAHRRTADETPHAIEVALWRAPSRGALDDVDLTVRSRHAESREPSRTLFAPICPSSANDDVAPG